ncbi:MAG TPA: hypothetical protein VFQ16_10605 [Burkholderiaceae bacterium]|nr:hypothetical protein [Burkholderiaceae bacterium]
MSLASRASLVALATLVAGCATAPGAGPAPGALPGETPSAPRRAAPSPLATEQRFLDDWFKGTPVVIALQGSGPLVVEVPLVHSFDRGSVVPKPALGAVLDRVAESLRRQPNTRVSVTAAADPGAAASQSLARMTKVREHLVARGVAATRVVLQPAGTPTAGAQLLITLVAAPIMRLDDTTLPPSAAITRNR